MTGTNPFKRGADPYADAAAVRALCLQMATVPMTAAQLQGETPMPIVVPITGYLRWFSFAATVAPTADSGAAAVVLGVYRASTLLATLTITGTVALTKVGGKITDEDIPVTEGEVLNVKAPFGATAGEGHVQLGFDSGALLDS